MTLYLFDTNELSNPKIYQKAMGIVDETRRNKVDAYVFDRDRRLSLGAGLLIAYFRKQHQISEADLLISETGKPEIAPCFSLHFNISHAGQYVLFCAENQPVGVDIEQIQSDYLSVAERFFTAKEQNQIFQKETLQQQEAVFFRLWTLKESYMKVTGLGFLLPLHEFSIAIEEEKVTFLMPKDANQKFRLQQLEAPIGYAASLCVSANYQGELPKKPTIISVESLLFD